MKWITAFFMTWGQFCAIPCPYKRWDNELRPRQIVCLPILGLVLGVIWAAIGFILALLRCPALISAAVMTAVPWLLTGFIHLDGFMDCADAILSRRDLETRLKILKDPTTGSFSVISFCIVLLFSYAAFASKEAGNFTALVFIPAATRACSALAVQLLKPIGHSSYAGSFSRSVRKGHVAAAAVMLVLAVAVPAALGLLSGDFFDGWLSPAAAAIGSWCTIYACRKDLGGMSGDISGCAITVGELCGALAWAII